MTHFMLHLQCWSALATTPASTSARAGAKEAIDLIETCLFCHIPTQPQLELEWLHNLDLDQHPPTHETLCCCCAAGRVTIGDSTSLLTTYRATVYVFTAKINPSLDLRKQKKIWKPVASQCKLGFFQNPMASGFMPEECGYMPEVHGHFP